VNLEKCFFRDVHNLLSKKKIVTSFSGREILLVLVFFYWGFSLFGTWNVGGGGGVACCCGRVEEGWVGLGW